MTELKVETDTETGVIWDTLEEYAARAQVSVATLNKWIKMGIPHIKLERIVRVDRAAADKWLRTHSSPFKRARRPADSSQFSFGRNK